MKTFGGYATLWGVPDLEHELFLRGAFAAGGLSAYPSIYLVNAHDTAQIAGVLTSAVEDNIGLWIKVAMFRTRAGNDAEQLIFDAQSVGARIGLSVAYLPRAPLLPLKDGNMAITSAILLHVALTPQPALPGARLDGSPLGPAGGKAFDGEQARRLRDLELANLVAMAKANGVQLDPGTRDHQLAEELERARFLGVPL